MSKEELAQEHHFIQTGMSVGKNQSHADLTLEYAKQQSIAFHAWMKKCQWSPLVSTIPGPDIYAPEDSDQRLTIEQLYTLFLQQQIK